jgi:KDO2-lipid IV(A) lauroyltransferase
MQKIGFYIIYSFIWTLTLLPFCCYYLVSDFLYFIIYIVVGYRKQIVRTNLKNSFPDKTLKELQILEKKFYKHLIDIFLESFKLIHLTEKELKKHWTYENLKIFEELRKKEKNIMMISAHYGTWEWLTFLGNIVDYKFLALYKPLSSGNFDKFLRKLRGKFGMETISMDLAFKRMLTLKKEDVPNIVWFAADQAPPKESQFWTTFLNQETGFFLGPEKLAKKLDYSVVFLDVFREKRGKYKAKFTLLFEDTKGTKDYYITKGYINHLETVIKGRPEFWLWSHKRWKHKRPENIPLQEL